jgi:hypothetical protein
MNRSARPSISGDSSKLGCCQFQTNFVGSLLAISSPRRMCLWACNPARTSLLSFSLKRMIATGASIYKLSELRHRQARTGPNSRMLLVICLVDAPIILTNCHSLAVQSVRKLGDWAMLVRRDMPKWIPPPIR